MTRRFNELLLGFDAREMWLEFSEDWSKIPPPRCGYPVVPLRRFR